MAMDDQQTEQIEQTTRDARETVRTSKRPGRSREATPRMTTRRSKAFADEAAENYRILTEQDDLPD